MKYFAIRSILKPSKFLPGYEKAGHTHREPTHWWIINPRLFMTRGGASRALSAWVKGMHSTAGPVTYEDEIFGTGTTQSGLSVTPVEGRKREDFEIVEVEMIVHSITSHPHILFTSKDFTSKEYSRGNIIAKSVIDGGLKICKCCGAAEVDLEKYPSCQSFREYVRTERLARTIRLASDLSKTSPWTACPPDTE